MSAAMPIVTLRMTPEEVELIDVLVVLSESRSRSEFLRDLVINAAGEFQNASRAADQARHARRYYQSRRGRYAVSD